ncbi:MAG TPA: P-type conjugative transfer protein TrbL [Gemmatimonadaceae bacterium]|nr:P-type conjugative transfer protein TrbL [Gemmatimonadaceae bacterium]
MRWQARNQWIGVACVGALLFVAGAGTVWAQSAPVQDPNAPVLGTITDSYRLASQIWLARLVPVAQRTFVLLAGIEVALSGLIYGIRRQSLDEAASRFVLKFGLLAFLFALITSFPLWVPKIVAGFAAAGELAVGTQGTTNPSDVIDLGIAIAGKLLTAFDLAGILRDPAIVFFGAMCAVIVFFAYLAVAVQLVLVLVESYIVLSGGVLFLGFASFRSTAELADGYLRYAIYVGIKIFLLYLVCGVGTALSSTWVTQLQTAPDLLTGGAMEWHVIGGTLVFAVMTLRIPNTIAGRITSHAHFGLANALKSL